MSVESITADAVKQALQAIRYAKPLHRNPLLGLDVLTLRLRADGVADTPASRAWALGRQLESVILAELDRLRGAPAPGPRPDRPADHDLAQLRADFQAGNPDREAWSILFHRYLAEHRLPVEELADALGLVARTLERRIGRGLQLLGERLRDDELAATSQLASAPGLPPRDRVVVGGGAEGDGSMSRRIDAEQGVTEGRERIEPTPPLKDVRSKPHPSSHAARALLEALRDDAQVVRLTPEDLQAIARESPADWDAYRLGRVAEWLQPRYRLDERFVALTLLVDQGEALQGRRWSARAAAFQDLRAVQSASDDAAFVLLGPPGSGKSTLLRRLELDLAIGGLRGETEAVTFFASLNHYRAAWVGDRPPPPRQWLAERWAARYPDLPPLDRLVDAGNVVFLLDAVNEMPHTGIADYRHKVMAWKQFLQDVVVDRPGNRAVFTCRSLDYSAPLSSPTLRVPQVRIEPMTDDQVRQFLEAYSPAQAEALWAEIDGTPQLGLFRSPYLLKLLVLQTESAADVPRGRAGLFTGFVRHALAREIERDNPLFAPDTLLSERDCRQIVAGRAWPSPHALPREGPLVDRLAALSYAMQAGDLGEEGLQVRADYDAACAMLDHPAADAILRAALALGVLDEDPDGTSVQFYHQLLQEYFAARRLRDEPHPDRVAAPWRAGDVSPGLADTLAALSPEQPLPPLPGSGWEETAVLAAAMARDADAFVAALAGVNLVVAARCAVEAEAPVSDALRDDLRRQLVARTRDPAADLRARIAAARALGRLGDPRFEHRDGPFGPCLLPPFVSIPGGTYPIGDDDGPPDAAPRHTVELAAFELAAMPVTNAEWACFLAAGGYDDPRWWTMPGAESWRQGSGTAEAARWDYRLWRRRLVADPGLLEQLYQAGRVPQDVYEAWLARLAMDEVAFEQHLVDQFPEGRRTEPELWRDPLFNHPLQPVVGVSWFEAGAYCAWLSAQTGEMFRLPTEVEWEAAACGTAGRRYAYGDAFDALAANTLESHVRATTPVGVFPVGDTPQGLMDMTGNVFEWTASLYGRIGEDVAFGYPYRVGDGREEAGAGSEMRRVGRGWSWTNREQDVDASHRAANLPDFRSKDVGVRLVRERSHQGEAAGTGGGLSDRASFPLPPSPYDIGSA